MNNNQKTFIRKELKGSNQKDKNLQNNHSNISINHRSRIRNGNYLTKNYKEKKSDQNLCLYEPLFQTLKPENNLNYLYNQPIQSIENKFDKIQDKYLERQNTASCLIPLSSYNGRIMSKYNINSNSSYNDKLDSKKIKQKINYQFNTENKSYKRNFNMNHSNLTNSYIHLYSNKYSPHKIPNEYEIQNEMYEKEYPYLNKKQSFFTNNNTIKKPYVNIDIKRKSEEKKNHLEKRIINSNKNNNLKIITSNIGRGYIDTKKIVKKLITEENNNDNKSMNFTLSCGNIKNFNNNFFHKIDNNSSINSNNLKRNEEKINNNKNQSLSFKYTNTEITQKENKTLFKKRNNLKYHSVSNSNQSSKSNLLYQKFVEIIKKIMNNRKNKYWNLFKNILLKKKGYLCGNSNSFIMKGNKKTATIDINKKTNNTLVDNSNNKKKIINNKIIEEIVPLRKSIKSERTNQKYKKIPNEKLKTESINPILPHNTEQINKNNTSLEERNKTMIRNHSKNNLFIENKTLNKKIRNFLAKYIINKKNNFNNSILKKSFYEYNKKTIIIANKENRKIYLLKKIINMKNEYKEEILRKYFIKFYYKSGFLSYKIKEKIYIKKEDFYIKKEKLIHIFYKKEKNSLLILKKYLDKLYYNSILAKIVQKNFDIIQNGNINIIKCNINNNNFELKKRKLKKIIEKSLYNNDLIFKSIFRQWALRTKIINMKIMIVKEENIKKIINPIEKLIKNKSNNNEIINNYKFKKDNLIKGIKKLNDIFTSYTNNRFGNGSEIEKILENKKDSITNDKNCNNSNNKDNIIYKIYEDKIKNKYKDDWIIEEKEEEQLEENGESIKNDSEKQIEEI